MLWGALNVNQVAGMIHIATRTGQMDSNKRPLYDPEILQFLNSSHFIQQYFNHLQSTRSFSFGDHLPGIVNPLDQKLVLSNYGIFWS